MKNLKEKLHNSDPLQRAFNWLVLATLILYLSMGGIAIFGWISNANRVNDIQQSRVYSCQKTYEGIKEVFKPFLSAPRKRTAQEQRDIIVFNKTIQHLKVKCNTQVKPK